MASLPVKLTLSVIGLVFAFAAASAAEPANARKHKKHAAAHTTTAAANSRYRGTNLFPAGPIYHANEYLGDDPDPNIRFQLLRDLGAHYGGEP